MDVLGLVDIPLWILILTGVLTLGYTYYVRKHSVWSSQGVKQVWPCLPFLGNVLPMFCGPWHEVEMKRCKKYGRIFGMYEGARPALVVSEPEIIRQVLVKDFPKFPGRMKMNIDDPLFKDGLGNIDGERWKLVRTIVSQTFSSGKMRKMSPLISECTKHLLENLHVATETEKQVDSKMVMGAFTMDVIARCAFGTKIDTHKDPNNPFITNAKQFFNFRMSPKLILMFAMPKICGLLGFRIVKKEVTDFFTDISRRLITERNEKKKDRIDFLQLLLDVSEFKTETVQEPKNSQESLFDLNDNANVTNQIQLSELKKKALTEREVLAQCMGFFVVGYETTATALSYALYHLALNPEAQERLAHEIHKTMQEHGEIEYDTLAKMPYLDAVVSETLRMNSPVVRLVRQAYEDHRLADTGIVVPKDALVVVPVYALHHDPDFFPDPETFNPDRFMPENKDNIIPYTYLPFGGGPRNCVALRFALMEAKICLANVLNEYKFSRCAETKVPLEYKPGSPLLQPRGIVLKVEKRS